MFDLLNFLNVMDLSGRQTLYFPAGSRLGSRARAADLELAMEKRDTVLKALPLEDADGTDTSGVSRGGLSLGGA